jgi:predicted esterase YcpF (UPF0227 family)
MAAPKNNTSNEIFTISSRCANPVTKEKKGLIYLKNRLKTYYSEETTELEQRSITTIRSRATAQKEKPSNRCVIILIRMDDQTAFIC